MTYIKDMPHYSLSFYFSILAHVNNCFFRKAPDNSCGESSSRRCLSHYIDITAIDIIRASLLQGLKITPPYSRHGEADLLNFSRFPPVRPRYPIPCILNIALPTRDGCDKF